MKKDNKTISRRKFLRFASTSAAGIALAGLPFTSSIARAETKEDKKPNISGREIDTLVGQQLKSGNHSALWKPENSVSDIFFYKLKMDSKVQTRKMLFLKYHQKFNDNKKGGSPIPKESLRDKFITFC